MTNIQKIIEEIMDEFDNHHSHCIASDGVYKEEEMSKILSDFIKRSYKEDRTFLLSSLNQIRQETLEEMKKEIKNWNTDKLGLTEINNGYSAVNLMKEEIINLIQSKKNKIYGKRC